MTLTTVYDAASRVVAMVYPNRGGAVIQSFTYTGNDHQEARDFSRAQRGRFEFRIPCFHGQFG
jgi:hypothetical protein